VSPGYSYSKAPDQESFLHRDRTHSLFRRILAAPKKAWRFNQSPLFLEFLMGNKGRDYHCTPWGNPTYNLFGWQKPCYLLQEGYAETFDELMETTDWDRYGHERNDKCRDCMVHSGYEATAVDHTFGSLGGFLGTVRAVLFGYRWSRVNEAEEGAPAEEGSGIVELPVVESSQVANCGSVRTETKA
jgi:hypothetical protein